MFTGIIEIVGVVRSIAAMDGGRRLSIEAPWAGALDPGESVAVDGVCLTAVDRSSDAFTVEAVRETVGRTIIRDYDEGARVHLERAMRLGDRLDGHLVQGHVDDVARVAAVEAQGENRYLSFAIPAPGRRFVAPRGSIAVNGVSLTVASMKDDVARIAIVPHTWEVTTLRDLEIGDGVNVEYDIVARYVQRLTETSE